MNNKFGELGHNAHWRTFWFVKQGDIEYTLFILHGDYKQCWHTLGLVIEAKFAKCTMYMVYEN